MLFLLSKKLKTTFLNLSLMKDAFKGHPHVKIYCFQIPVS